MSEQIKSELVSLARNCKANFQYVNAITYMKEVIRLGFPLNMYERSLIKDSFTALKGPIDDILEDKNINKKLPKVLINNAKKAIGYLCKDAVFFLEKNLVEKDLSKEAIADYKYFKALQYKDLAFNTANDSKEDYKNKAVKLFEEAMKIASGYLSAAHPIRLQISHDLSKFIFEVLKNDDEAYEVACEAYDVGLLELPDLDENLKHRAQFSLDCLLELIDRYFD